MIVFHTDKQTAYQRVERPKKDVLEALQGYVGGHIETLPHPQGWDAPFVAYANEEGMITDLPSNYLAWGVLSYLGFNVRAMPTGFYFGNVVLLGKNQRALTENQFNQVNVALAKYLKEVGGDEEDEESDKVEKPRVDQGAVLVAKRARTDITLPTVDYDTFPKTKRVKKENKV